MKTGRLSSLAKVFFSRSLNRSPFPAAGILTQKVAMIGRLPPNARAEDIRACLTREGEAPAEPRTGPGLSRSFALPHLVPARLLSMTALDCPKRTEPRALARAMPRSSVAPNRFEIAQA